MASHGSSGTPGSSSRTSTNLETCHRSRLHNHRWPTWGYSLKGTWHIRGWHFKGVSLFGKVPSLTSCFYDFQKQMSRNVFGSAGAFAVEHGISRNSVAQYLDNQYRSIRQMINHRLDMCLSQEVLLRSYIYIYMVTIEIIEKLWSPGGFHRQDALGRILCLSLRHGAGSGLGTFRWRRSVLGRRKTNGKTNGKIGKSVEK